MAPQREPLKLMGAPGSPYTRKMLAVLRYRHIPYSMMWGGHGRPPGTDYPVPKVRLLPTFYFPDADGRLEAAVDSTPIIRRLEADYTGRSILPDHPALAWINDLIEDFGDEWLTKAMFHYRWAYQDDIKNAGPMLIYWSEPTLEEGAAMALADQFAERQIGRLYVVGSNETTAETIEASYQRTLGILVALIQQGGFILGDRPASCDFAVYGQLTQLGVIDPTPARVTRTVSMRVRAWLDRVEDLSGHEGGEWRSVDEAARCLRPLLTEIGRVYAPFLLANARAVMAGGGAAVDGEIDGRPWTQPAFPYQAKCLGWIREGFVALPSSAQMDVMRIIAGTGCEAMLDA
ncbi:MAG: glutathione S-transferase N-terminal domain-containing protein [Alphaproteobacteria bacterium]